MAPKKYQPITLELEAEPEAAQTVKTDSAELRIDSYGQQSGVNCTVPYPGARRSINATVNPMDLQRSLTKQKASFQKYIADNCEYQRVKKGRRSKTHKLPMETEYLDNGEVTVTRPTTTTTRLEH